MNAAVPATIETLPTPRLIDTRLRRSDAADISQMNHDPRVMATLAGLRAEDENHRMFEAALEHWELHGFGTWIFRDRRDQHFVGRAGLRRYQLDGVNEIELLYTVGADDWNKGYATEMARACLSVAFDSLRMSEVVTFTLPTNLASRRVMKKLGFQYERGFMHAKLPHVLYRLKR